MKKKKKKVTWLGRCVHLIHPPEQHHRTCRNCKKLIHIHDRWHYQKIGWFAPIYCIQHDDCADPGLQKKKMGVLVELPLFDGWIEQSGDEAVRKQS